VLTAVDSSVLLDVLKNDPAHGPASAALLRKARAEGALIVCAVVWAEVRGFFTDQELMDQAFANVGIRCDQIDRDCANEAGLAWSFYRRSGGSRTRVIADFLIGAHSKVRGARLLTRDRGFYRTYFSDLAVIDPSA
jgi:predicted nucleic acid-binding protein